MRADLEVTITHDGCNWIANHHLFKCDADTLEEIDQQITSIIHNTSEFKDQQFVEVFMGFDFDTIPTWLRQYHTHYFNRILKISNSKNYWEGLEKH